MWGHRLFISLLNSSMAELGSPVPMGFDLICSEAGFTSLLVLRHFCCVFYEFFFMLQPGH